MRKSIPFIYMDFRVHSHCTEDESKVKSAIAKIFGEIDIKRKSLTGFHGNPIIVLSGRIEKRKTIKFFLSSLPTDYLGTILQEAQKRIDENLMLHFRLDKQAAFEGDIARPSDLGDTISIAIKIEAFPATLGKALESLSDFFKRSPRRSLDKDRHT